MLQDLRTALRAIARDRWMTAAAVTALALGIGVNATVFTLVNAVLIKGLPFPESHNIYFLGIRNMTQPGTRAGSVSFRELTAWQEQSRAFEGMGGYQAITINLADDAELPEQQQGARLTTNVFQVLRTQPVLGRDLTPADGRPGAERVVILGDGLWRRRYGGDPAVIGRAVRVNGEPATVIGVMGPGMMFPTNAELWVQVTTPVSPSDPPPRDLGIVGRLREGVSRREAQTDLDTIAARLAAQYPESNRDIVPVIQTANERFNGGEIRVVFLAMLGAVGFVLLIACANVANLQLSRSMQRTREIAVRVALGATRWRIVRQLLVESVLIASIGGVFGLLIAFAGIPLFDAAVADSGKPYWIQFTIDLTVVAYLAAVCVATGIIFGLAPALQISRTNVNATLKEGGRGTTGGRRAAWLSGGMVVVELALTLVLLTGAGQLIRSFMALYTVDPGVATERLSAMRLMLPSTKYAEAEKRRGFYDQLLPRIEALAGVEAVSVTTTAPGFGPAMRRMFVDGREAPSRWQDHPETGVVLVSPGFFPATGLEIVRGRALTESDGLPGAEAVVVNERFLAAHFPGEDPLGRRIRFPPANAAPDRPAPPWMTIVGVSRNIRHSRLEEESSAAVVYISHRQEPPYAAMLLVRSAMEPGAIMQAVRQEVQRVDADQPVFTIQTLEQMRERNAWPYRVFGTIFAIFALIALTLAAVGLYAVMAYSVSQRTQEIGVRMALGAGGRHVSWLVLRRGLVQLGIGLALGLAGAYFAAQILESVLVPGTGTREPLVFGAITALLVGVALAACLVPARRATRVDPLVALRE